MPYETHPDREIARIADRQHSVVAGYQLSLTRDAIKHRVDAGRLYRKYRGVYTVGHRKLTREGEWMAAALAYGPKAVLSHRSAGALWGLTSSSSKIHVTTPCVRKSRAGITHHRAPLHELDVIRLNGIPVTSVARTIYDLASCLTESQVRKAVEAADRRDLLEMRALEAAIARRPGARGVTKLKAVLDDYRLPPDTRSPLEDDFLDLVRRAGLPPPATNVLLDGYTADVYWPQWELIVELDGRPYHFGPRAFEDDRIRDTVHQKHGRRVMRITRRRLTKQRQEILADIEIFRRLPVSRPAAHPPP
jgi:predicted transcriptional regulator of viral defense system